MIRRSALTAPCLFALVAAGPVADTRGYPVQDFERIRVVGPYEVTVAAGPTTRVDAEGSAAALAGVRVATEAGTLTIQPRRDGPAGPLRFRVTTRTLSAATLLGDGRLRIDRAAGPTVRLVVNGGGTVAVDEVRAGRLSATIAGGGTLAMAGRADDALVGAVGAPRIDGDGLTVGDLTLNAQGGAVVALRATGSARVIATGPAAITISGSAACVTNGSDVAIRCEGGIRGRR